MNSSQKLAAVSRMLFALFVLAIALALLFEAESRPAAQAPQSAASQSERQLENLIPKHVPLDVKVTKEKEKAWKDLKNENWARDFELEITNTGDKPIYTFYLLVFFDVPNDFEDQLVAPIYYGRPEISNPRDKAGPDDVPIKPGESKVFRIHPNQVIAFDKGRREKGWRLPKQGRIKLEVLTFGDGTGLMGNEGVPYPRSAPQASKPNAFTSQPTRGRSNAVTWRSVMMGRNKTQRSTTGLPAVLPVNSYWVAPSESVVPGANAQLDDCETGCDRMTVEVRVTCYGCAPQSDPSFTYDPAASCFRLSGHTISCTIPETGVTYGCPVQDVGFCFGPAPTPIPTATPTPLVCEYCTSDAQCCPGTHCSSHVEFCIGDYYFGCDDHFVDDCWWNSGYVPVGTCECRHDSGGPGGGDGGPGGTDDCYYGDCSCELYNADWECRSGLCGEDGYCWEDFVDPILIDTAGNGFSLTEASNGVKFDFFAQGRARQISWTDTGSDDAWLVLDRNRNGKIDSGQEMFSNVTPQFGPPASHLGFLALALLDKPPAGGNGDGMIDQRDPAFARLRLWQDVNHNGIAEASELHTLPELGVESISLDYKESRRTDRWGNTFRYRAKVYGTNHKDLGRWAYDVVLQSLKPAHPPQSIADNLRAHSPFSNGEMFGSSQSHRLGEVFMTRDANSFMRAISRTSVLSW